MGFLPGEAHEKMAPYIQPLLEKLCEMLPKSQIDLLEKEERIDSIPLGFLRGLNWNAKCILADEAQNMTSKELITLITRTGEFSKVFIMGDPDQSDINGKSGFTKIVNLFDDEESRQFFEETWHPFIAQSEATTKVFETERFGYLRLYKYVNFLAEQATGDWIMFWNDDAVMLTENWDDAVVNETGYFGLLRMPCVNMNHPFALFPIIPRSWVDFFGRVSPVNHSDWWI